MFEQISLAPADPILGLNEAFNADSRGHKVNLGVGVYKDSQGKTPILECVKKAETLLLDREISKSYLGIAGHTFYGEQVQTLMFGHHSDIIKQNRANTAQTPGGTGALKVAADFIKKHLNNASLWLSDPSWANHQQIFANANVPVKHYRYYNSDTKSLDFDALLTDLNRVPEGDVVLFHACCHNPTGVDPSQEQWQDLAELALEKKFLVLFDMAYQGFAKGLDEDVYAVRLFAEKLPEMLIANSFSKNFGLYNERIGAFTLIAENAKTAEYAFSQAKTCIRTNYSNPPAHGGLIVSTILENDTLHAQWENELTGMRVRIQNMRVKLESALSSKIPGHDFSFINQQNGMFSFSGLTKEQVNALKEQWAIYIVGSGRINVAGITESNIDYLTDAIASVY